MIYRKLKEIGSLILQMILTVLTTGESVEEAIRKVQKKKKKHPEIECVD